MKRTPLALTVLSIAAIAQQPTAPLSEAYRAWRSGHPDLERDSRKGETGFGTSVEKGSTDEAKYSALHRELLEGMRDEAQQQLGRLEDLGLRVSFEENANQLDAAVTAAKAANSASREAVSAGSDRGLRPLQQALDRERAALQTIEDGIKNRRKLDADLAEASNTSELARNNVSQKYGSLASEFDQHAQGVARQQLAWTEYYRLLNPTARSGIGRDAALLSSAANGARITTPRVSDPAPAPLTRPITPLPLSRYMGEWQYSTAARVYKGLEPEFAELVVHEQDGQAAGTLNMRFKAAPDAPSDRTVRFNFSGPLQATRNQSFRLETANGVTGTIALIPGTAINLIEVNFETEARPGNVNAGNFVLLKK